MIVKMQKVTLLCAAPDREPTLEVLRNLGVMHVEHVKRPEGEDLEQARAQLLHLKRALEVLPKRGQTPPSDKKAAAVVEDVWALIQRRKDLQEKQDSLRHERLRLLPFGSFDPNLIRSLEQKGIHVRLYQAGIKQELVAPEGACLNVLSRDKTNVYVAVIGRGEIRMPGQEFRLPELSLSAIDKRLAEIARQLAEVEKEMDARAGEYAKVHALVTRAEEQTRFLEVRNGMGNLKPIAYLQGYCPESRMEQVRLSASQHGWGLIFAEPGPGDMVPTLLENPPWVKTIKPLMDFIGIVPGYNEVDLSMAILFFFSLFFAMLVGDAGYGALFLGFSLWGRRKFKTAPPEIFAFLNVMSCCTIVWGVITGNYFGITPGHAPLKIAWLTKEDNVKLLCFIIGVTQLSLAHLWNIVRMRRSLQALAQIGWLCTTWTMFFFANTMVLGFAFPRIMLPIFAVGVVLIILFMTPVKSLKDEWFNHAMLPLNLVSNFVDVVSYIRLFAVGTASYAVASSFNAMLAPMFGHWFTALFAAVFLFLAHALNIVLAIMGVMVHGVRLNTLEFSGHVGMQWTGVPYEPFKKTERP